MSNSAPTSSADIALEEKPAATTTNTAEWDQVGNCSCLDQLKAAPGSASDQGQKPS
ncbi:hypothetical protein [Variovorax sp. E3]|uniref:hypothetical protein n=1 Tax=Variovorax sp. E3 TaxID=1914993 RepID=UPI0018DD4CFD|nr:hypothetical protein [Variovorax sp. E3]